MLDERGAHPETLVRLGHRGAARRARDPGRGCTRGRPPRTPCWPTNSAPDMMARQAVAASITVPAPAHILSPYFALTAAMRRRRWRWCREVSIMGTPPLTRPSAISRPRSTVSTLTTANAPTWASLGDLGLLHLHVSPLSPVCLRATRARCRSGRAWRGPSRPPGRGLSHGPLAGPTGTPASSRARLRSGAWSPCAGRHGMGSTSAS